MVTYNIIRTEKCINSITNKIEAMHTDIVYCSNKFTKAVMRMASLNRVDYNNALRNVDSNMIQNNKFDKGYVLHYEYPLIKNCTIEKEVLIKPILVEQE